MSPYVRGVFQRFCLIIVLFYVFAFEFVEAKKKRKPGVAQKKMEGFWKVVKYLLFFLLAPPILTFVYYLVRDPMTPHIIMELWYRCKDKTTGYIGKSSNVMSRKLYKDD